MARRPDEVRSWREAPPARSRRYAWKAEVERGGRGPSRFGLIVAAALCLATIVYLLFLLTRPPRPCFIAVAADPAADALRLDAPLDLLGRRSAERFLDGASNWVGRGGRRGGRVEPGPVRLSADREELREWAAGFRSYDPVVMYLGVPCTVSDWYGPAPERDGPGAIEPVLHVGGGKRLPVRWLFEEVTTALPGRRVVILLDPGRLPPDPTVGHLRDDFTERVAEVYRQVQPRGHRLVVVCGAGPGQRGWESEELGATAFAHALIRTFDEPGGRKGLRTLDEFFTEVSERLSVWSANNRPAPQAPVLLSAESLSRARLSVRPAGQPSVWEPVRLPTPEARKEWRERWEARARLAAMTPHPATYTPRLWRRYQELLLRFDRATRVGDPEVVDRLIPALRAAEADLAQQLGQVFRPFSPVPAEARPASFGLSQAFGTVTGADPADPTAALWDLARDPTDALPVAAGDPAYRPSERHLAVMVQRFYRTVITPPQPTPEGWRKGIELRVRADRAALGLPAPGRPLIRPDDGAAPTAAALSERVSPVSWNDIDGADRARRRAEDLRFGAVAQDAGADTERQYDVATDRAAAVRFAYHVRDTSYADLPYLGRWAVAAGTGDDVAGVWAKVHRLDDLLRDRPERTADTLAPAAREAWAGVNALRERFAAAAREHTGAALQKSWAPKEALLASPLLRPEDRERLLTAAREFTYKLLTEPTGPVGGPPSGTVPPPNGAAWERLATAELGLPAGGDDAQRAAAAYRRQSPPGNDEREGRTAVAFLPGEEVWREPAAEIARRQWAELFSRLADRATTDHWYDENPGRGGAPYYARVARRYRADARTLGRPTPEPPEPGPLTVTPTEPSPVRWTSDRRRTLTFTLTTPAGVPDGTPVLFRGASGSAIRSAAKPLEPGQALEPGKPQIVLLPLTSDAEDEVRSAASATAGAYYRGQHPVTALPILVTRRPELVVTDPTPRSMDAAVAVRADPAQALNPVAVLLDYSGSMKEGLNGFRLPGGPDAWKEGESKFNIALKRLEVVLAELPKGTPLRVRTFSARGVADVDEVVYPKPGERAVADWRGADDEQLKDLISRLRRLEPSGTTPLIQSIITAARADLPERADGPKTLVVLTDGADDSGQPGVAKEVRDQFRSELKNVLTATGVRLIVVQLALNEADKAVSRELFADLPNLDVPGEVVSVDDAEGLRRELASALWPRLVLTGTRSPGAGRYPAGGWPARPTAAPRGAADIAGALDPNTLLWSPALPAGRYSARVAGYPARGFPKVDLEPGDFLSLSLTRTSGEYVLRRELYADAFGRALKAFRQDGAWVLSVGPPGIEDAREEPAFGAVAVLEKVPPHLLGRAVTPEDPLRHFLPAAMWWHVAPSGDAPLAGVPLGRADGVPTTKTVVTRLYGYPAPAWDIRVAGWPRGAATEFEPATIRAWVPRTDPTPVPLPRVQPPQINSEPLTVRLEGYSFRVTREMQRFEGADEEVECLVVRTEYPTGAPVQLRLVGQASGVRTEHRYFKGANAYTAVFGPGAAPPGVTNLQFELIQVREFATDEGAMIRLLPPAPTLGRRADGYRPVPSKVGP
jgi:hypothetical protein